jgi:predicted phage-related endonuclease
MKTSLGFGARHRFGDDGTDEVDDGVLLQMQGYMMLTGADTSFVAALVPGPELKVFTVRADPEVHDLITDGIARFWRCVQSNTPPPPQTQGDLRRLYPTDNGNAVEAPPEIERAVESLRETAARIKALEGQRTALEVAIKGHIGEAATLTDINGKTLATWKTQAATRLDTTRLKAEAPDLYAKFATTSTTRVLRLPGGAR